jgi:hypothetical protein
MSLWTPGGEIPVNRRRDEPTAPPAGSAQTPRADRAGADAGAEAREGLSLDELSPEERAQAEELLAQMAEAQRQLATTPAQQIVATHAAGLYELAAIKLRAEPPQFDDARLAIDALAAIVDGVGNRLGDDGPALRDALRSIQLAFVQLRERAGSA